ncbi:MAG: pyridoxamine 5'-phosphate oxidase [Phycisphaerae bacterium]|jgi:pyridoxamine 5'-phosphate oxidase|nr:pyridoxamine 5'-phosphate oxidase [Phycisphaerae bacterium]MCZ2401067.1 pyridoxamine 5'-phosphate oxidase [Phycisphaerae bacterium]NUQ50108.1 pyridoxamine 5'-phosphate oxidase [Phycisphaerae bacterium]
MDKPIGHLRRDYALQVLLEADAHPDPVQQFDKWFDDAVRAGLVEPNGMTLATADADGRPSARVVLLKGYDARGFVFYTSYRSRKARDLAQNPRAALCAWWPILERQVRIEGLVEQTSRRESQDYFATRPRASQLGAWVSDQSSVIDGRAGLEKRLEELRAAYQGRPIPCPPEWGGFRLVPSAFEFWQGREGRLHDRLRYRRDQGRWVIERVSP